MKALKFEIEFKRKEGFTMDGFKRAIKKSVEEIDSSLIGFEGESNSEISRCVCAVSIINTEPIPFYQLLFGGISVIQEEYPYVEKIGIPQEKMEIVEV